MRSITFIATILLTGAAMAISSSTPVGDGSSSYNQLSVRLYNNFSMADGNLVQQGSISQISYSDVWLGGQSMILKVNGDNYRFKLKQNIAIQKGYATAAGTTSAGSTGQGIGVAINERANGPWNTYEELKERTCSGRRVEACIILDGGQQVCDSERTSGYQTDLVEYGDRNLAATVSLTSGSGTRLADISYSTKEFRTRTLVSEYYPCDADSYSNVRATRRAIRQRLREKYNVDQNGVQNGEKIKSH